MGCPAAPPSRCACGSSSAAKRSRATARGDLDRETGVLVGRHGDVGDRRAHEVDRFLGGGSFGTDHARPGFQGGANPYLDYLEKWQSRPAETRTQPPTADNGDLKPVALGRASDEELMKRTQNGDRQAYSMLYERYSASVLSYLYRMLGNVEDVESIGQEVFLRAFRFAATYRYPQKFSTWLFTITRNLAINHARRRKRSPVRNVTELNLEGVEMSGDLDTVQEHATSGNWDDFALNFTEDAEYVDKPEGPVAAAILAVAASPSGALAPTSARGAGQLCDLQTATAQPTAPSSADAPEPLPGPVDGPPSRTPGRPPL